MVKRIVLLALPIMLISLPAAAQDYSVLEIALGYGNWGADASESGGNLSTDDTRVGGFAMHTDINFTSWFGFDNYLGAYSMPGDLTLITNIFGAKVTGRDVLDGRISPYAVAGFGFGYYSANNFGGSLGTSAARYGGGVDVNMNDAIALRFDVGALAVGTGLTEIFSGGAIDEGWTSRMNVTAGVLFKLGY
jgi:hypothetical protein